MTEPAKRTPFASFFVGIALDLVGFGGAAVVSLGVWEIYRPAGHIVAGLFLLAGAWLTARKSA